MTASKLKELILAGSLDEVFSEISGGGDIEKQKSRAVSALAGFEELYGDIGRDVRLFSVGGRTEISGNHTDHNRGKVIAASVNMNVFAAAAVRDDNVIRIKSEGHREDVSPADGSEEPGEAGFFTSRALICGTARAFRDRGLKTGGFDAYTVSDVLKGSGLSSSAAFEVIVGKIMSCLYNDDAVSDVELAKIAKFAENEYFGKPCGLMDQAACAVGSLVAIDFADPDDPVIERLDFDLESAGFRLCITDTRSSHADLNEDYAAIPREMKSVAAFFKKEYLSEIDEKDLLENISALREAAGDRAVLRAFHFFEENRRVERQAEAAKRGDVDAFLENVTSSGLSSFRFLQNVYSPSSPQSQGVSLALMMSESFLAGKGGACRVHGGGFAGTVQAFVPTEFADEYKCFMEKVFGAGSCHMIGIRRAGALTLH